MAKEFQYRRLLKDDAVVLLVDHQSGLISLVQDFSPGEFKNNVLALADIAKYFKLPTILTTSFEDGPTMNWFSVACELHRDWRNDVEGLGNLLSNHLPPYRNLITSYLAKNKK